MDKLLDDDEIRQDLYDINRETELQMQMGQMATQGGTGLSSTRGAVPASPSGLSFGQEVTVKVQIKEGVFWVDREKVGGGVLVACRWRAGGVLVACWWRAGGVLVCWRARVLIPTHPPT